MSKRSGKYNAKRTTVDNISFASQKEAEHYVVLKAMLRTKQIRNLQLQPRFPMPPESWGRIVGVKSARDPGCICTYQADFSFEDPDGTLHIQDTKGVKTPVFRLKERMFKFFYPAYNLEVL